MAKRIRKGRGERRQSMLSPELSREPDEIRHTASKEPLKPKNEAQKRYINSLNVNTLTFALGPAGTGKTYVAVARAAEMLRAGEIERIVITRPAVEAEENLGYLPGELEEKFDPYFLPVKEILIERLGSGFVEAYLKNEKIVVRPLAYLRGHTFKNCFVLLDEAQNTTPGQMKLFLTRIGERCKISVNGDLKQSDIRGRNGLQDALPRLEHIRSIGSVTFDRGDIVRSGLVQEIVEAYEGERAETFNPPAFLRDEN